MHQGLSIDLLGCSDGQTNLKANGVAEAPSKQDIKIIAGDSRSVEDIMKIVRQRTPGLRHVYNKFLKNKPEFQGTITLKLTIAPSGEVIEISIVSSTTGYS